MTAINNVDNWLSLAQNFQKIADTKFHDVQLKMANFTKTHLFIINNVEASYNC